MSLVVRSTKDLLNPATYKAKILVVGAPGSGKTRFLSTVPGIGIAACETGEGNGLLTLGDPDIPKVDFVEPGNKDEFEAFCAGRVFKENPAVGVDSLTEMVRAHVQSFVLTIPRRGFESEKRRMGVPEQDDYGTMGELTRRYLRQLLSLDKHVVCTAGIRIKEPNEANPSAETMIGPDLPGAMFLGAVAMFDIVVILRTRSVLRDPKDAKSRYLQRYFVCEPMGGMLAKCRPSWAKKSLLAPEEVFDLNTGAGTFPYFLNKITAGFVAEAPTK